MTRFLAFAGVVALPLLLPAVTLAVPPGGLPVYRPALPPPPPVVAAPSRDRSERDRFAVPFGVNVQPKPLPESHQGPAIKWSPDVGWRPPEIRRQWLVPNPGYLWFQPAWYQPSCVLSNGFNAPSASPTMAPDVTIGSLVDKNSRNLFSIAPSHTAQLTVPDSGGATASSPLGLQYQFQATPCGTANSINF